MKIVFFGTPEYVLPVLTSLHRKFVTGPGKSPIVAVVTQSPKPTGRKQILSYSKIDHWAHERDIPIFYNPQDLIKNNVEAEIGVLAAYGSIIPKNVLEMFLHGILNIHPSLLPKFRGASPVQATLVTGEKLTGSTIIKLDEKLDHGPIVTQFKEDILPEDSTDLLRERLFQRSAVVLLEMIEPYMHGKIKLKPQDHDQATHTTQIKKEHGFIPPTYISSALEGKSTDEEWSLGFIKDNSIKPTPENIEMFVRAMTSWPGAWSNIDLFGKPKRIKILKAHLDEEKLILDQVQLEGKNEVTWDQFTTAYPEAKFK